MKKDFFALLRMFACMAFVPMLSMSLVACSPDDVAGEGGEGETEEELTEPTLRLETKTVTISYEEHIFEVALKTNVDYRYKIDPAAWFLRGFEENKDGERVLKFIISENKTRKDRTAQIYFSNVQHALTDTFTLVQQGNPEAFEYVDLGLEVLWATCNLGAKNPEEFGNYYAWGEVEPKDEYTLENYQYYKDGKYDPLTTSSSTYIQGTEYDAAHVLLGDGWCMPTATDIHELEKKCKWEWVEQNGVIGQLVTGPNGKSMFLPATGLISGTELLYVPQRGYYWTAAVDYHERKYDISYYMTIGKDDLDVYVTERYKGLTIRPIKRK